MAQYGDPEGTFSSIKTVAEPGDVTAYRTTPQFAVSVGKFAVMSLCTFGFYEVYWAYKHWDAMRKREQERLSPFWPATFRPPWRCRVSPRGPCQPKPRAAPWRGGVRHRPARPPVPSSCESPAA